MKKITCLLFVFCLLFACKPTVQKQEVVKRVEPKSEPITNKITPKGDTILLTHNQTNAEYWIKSGENVGFSNAWLEKALTYKGDTLPTHLAEYLLPIFPTQCMQESLYFDISYCNTDEDVENECVLFFFNSCAPANIAITVVLEKENNNWFVGTITRGMARHPLENIRPTFDEKHKIIVAKDGGWGMAQSNLNHELYKKYMGRYHKIAQIENYEKFFCHFGGYFIALCERVHTSYEFLDIGRIQITRYYSFDENGVDNPVRFIKSRPLQEIMQWDKTKQMYVSEGFAEKEQAFYENLEKELLYMAYYGTPEQQKHLEFFLINKGLKK